jgi:predicted CDP-diglyceride synthetase/phosphatidate cytidylyltransferase
VRDGHGVHYNISRHIRIYRLTVVYAGFYRCIVVATRKNRISDEEHFIERHMQIFFHLMYAIFLINSFSCDINGRRTTDTYLEVGYTFLYIWEHREALLTIWIPYRLDMARALLSKC